MKKWTVVLEIEAPNDYTQEEIEQRIETTYYSMTIQKIKATEVD